MKEAVRTEKDAVAIAAPQIGVSLRAFVIGENVFPDTSVSKTSEKETKETKKKTSPQLVFINPEITNRSKKEEETEEGCLSVRWWYGKVKRAQKMTVSAFDEEGKKFTRGASGLLAEIFQHEIDHLNGVLFIDKARELHEMLPVDNRV